MLREPTIRPRGSEASKMASVPAAITTPMKKMPAHMRPVMTPWPGGRGGAYLIARAAGGARGSIHVAGVRGVAAERERGRAVGEEVDPEDLRGEERRHETLAARRG